MLQAQIHHKVPREFEGMEDVLTSSTIGLLSYLPVRLAVAVVAELADVKLEDEAVEVALWQSCATPPGFRTTAHPDNDAVEVDSVRGRTEPDAVLSGAGWLVVVEAKYHSPLDETYDQLGREFAIGFDEARRKGLRFRLLVLTAHALQPTPAGVSLIQGVQEAVAKSHSTGASEMVAAVPDSLRWKNWQRLYRILHDEAGDLSYPPHTRELLGDACKLLKMHGLVPYDGAGIKKAMLKWQSSGIPEDAWASPLVYRSRTMASLKTGWGEIIGLDVSCLGALAWRPYVAAMLGEARPPQRRSVQLEDFELNSLQPIQWQPYQQGGDPS